MRRAVVLLMVLGLGIIMSVGTASAALDYLVVKDRASTPAETAQSGGIVNFQVSLQKSTNIRPQNATLVITNELVNPRIELTIDDSTEIFFNKDRIEKELNTETVSLIKISASGNAPTVNKRIRRILLDVKTKVYYDEEHQEPEEEISFPLYITNPDIEDAVDAIDNARDKLKEANRRIFNLEARGVDTSALEDRAITAENIIDSAERSHDLGQPIEAQRLAENAIDLLDDIIDDARELEQTSAQTSEMKQYLAIGAAIIVVLAAFLYFKGKREELG
ncbi:MAG: hypothetical protein ACE5HY_01245 [Candidatus Hydrothermarchaeales archaeon]